MFLNSTAVGTDVSFSFVGGALIQSGYALGSTTLLLMPSVTVAFLLFLTRNLFTLAGLSLYLSIPTLKDSVVAGNRS